MRAIEILDKITKWICAKVMLISVAALAVMLVLTMADIVGGKLFSAPVKGSIDLTAILLLVAGAFGIAQAEVLEKHVRVDFFTVKLSPRVQLILRLYNALLGIFIFGLAFWTCLRYSISLFHSGEGTLTMEIVWWPFVGFLAFNLLLMLFVSLNQIFGSWKGIAKR